MGTPATSAGLISQNVESRGYPPIIESRASRSGIGRGSRCLRGLRNGFADGLQRFGRDRVSVGPESLSAEQYNRCWRS